jgi:hypothetical protein
LLLSGLACSDDGPATPDKGPRRVGEGDQDERSKEDRDGLG